MKTKNIIFQYEKGRNYTMHVKQRQKTSIALIHDDISGNISSPTPSFKMQIVNFIMNNLQISKS